MTSKIFLSKDLCEIEAIKFVASRYATTPEQVLEHYLIQAGIVKTEKNPDDSYSLAPNEMALFRDLGVQPSEIEIR